MTTEITLDEAKLHCRIDDDYEDTLIQAYIDAA
ncbi:head-tail connector protein, partial [Enterobacter hormaechei]